MQRGVVGQGIELLQQRRYEEAYRHLRGIDPMSTGDHTAHMAYAVAADMTGNFRTSDRIYAELGETYPERAVVLNNRGYSHMLRGELDKALVYLREAERLDPGNAVIRNNLDMLRSVGPTR
ncbi:tetratricopeptide repeat protein [Rhodovulum bhavnagarense]|nr:tetratricopeptide repeat protein [Rhodovulum bhavnagarense]